MSSYITYSAITTLAGEYTTCLGEYCWSFTGEVYTVDDYIVNQLEFKFIYITNDILIIWRNCPKLNPNKNLFNN